jgi:hypothetical protein
MSINLFRIFLTSNIYFFIVQYLDKSFREFTQFATHLSNTTFPMHTCNLMPRVSLVPKSANARVQKQQKTSKKELSPHKHIVIEGMYLASISNSKILRLTEIPESTVWSTIKLFSTRLKGHSLPRSSCPPKLDRVTKRNIIRFVRQNVKTTYAQVRQKLSLNCSDRMIARIVRKQGIKK